MLEYSDFLIFLLFIAIIGVVLVAFTLGLIVRFSAKPEAEKTKVKKKMSQKRVKSQQSDFQPVITSRPDIRTRNESDPCPQQNHGYYFGFLKKELDKKTPIPSLCLPCELKLECLEGKKPK